MNLRDVSHKYKGGCILGEAFLAKSSGGRFDLFRGDIKIHGLQIPQPTTSNI